MPDGVWAAAPLLAQLHRGDLLVHALGDDLIPLLLSQVLGVGGIGEGPNTRIIRTSTGTT